MISVAAQHVFAPGEELPDAVSELLKAAKTTRLWVAVGLLQWGIQWDLNGAVVL